MLQDHRPSESILQQAAFDTLLIKLPWIGFQTNLTIKFWHSNLVSMYSKWYNTRSHGNFSIQLKP